MHGHSLGLIKDGLVLLGVLGLPSLVAAKLLGRPIFKLRWRPVEPNFRDPTDVKLRVQTHQRNSLWCFGWGFSIFGAVAVLSGIARLVLIGK